MSNVASRLLGRRGGDSRRARGGLSRGLVAVRARRGGGGARAARVHWLLAKPLAPLAPAGYVGVALALWSAPSEAGSSGWSAGVLTTLALAFLLKGLSATRQAPTASISATVMGAVWIGCGLAFVLLLRDLPEHGRLAAFTVVLAVWAGDTLAYVGGRLLGRHKMAPNTSPGKTWEGFVVRHRGDGVRRVRGPVQAALPHDRRVDRARRRRSRSPRRWATSSSRC